MKVRLEGSILEIEWAVESLKKVCEVRSRSKLYPSRDNKGYRCYIEIFPNGGNLPRSDDVVLGGRD